MADKESEGKNADAGDKAFAKGEDKPRRRRSRGGEDDAASKDAGAAGDKAAEKPAQKPSRSKERRSRAVMGTRTTRAVPSFDSFQRSARRFLYS